MQSLKSTWKGGVSGRPGHRKPKGSQALVSMVMRSQCASDALDRLPVWKVPNKALTRHAMAKYARGRAHWPLQESIEYEEIPHIASLIRVPSRREESCPTNPFVRCLLRQEARHTRYRWDSGLWELWRHIMIVL